MGTDEVLLDGSTRCVQRAVEAGVDIRLDIWEGMVHGFLGGIERLSASSAALGLISESLVEQFSIARSSQTHLP